MKKIKYIIIITFFILKSSYVYSDDNFDVWKINFKKYALKQGISTQTLNRIIDKSIFLPDEIFP